MVLTIKRPEISKNWFFYTSSFLKGFFATKKLNIELKEMFDLFLEGCLSSFLKGQLAYLNKTYNDVNWHVSTMQSYH